MHNERIDEKIFAQMMFSHLPPFLRQEGMKCPPAMRGRLLLPLLALFSLAWAGGDDILGPITRFDSKGQLPQSNAAAQAVQRGGPVVGIAGDDHVLLVASR